jgi:NAD(P)-dependent dehydrogenase (short-subunit alcohol dehydrogenase family)
MPADAKTVLVTGASGGVGSAVVKRLDELGWLVLAGVRSPNAGEQLSQGRRSVTTVWLDITDPESIAKARDEIAARLRGQGLRGLVNNAGLVVMGPLELVPVHALRRQFEVNLIGQLAVTQAFLPLLRVGGGRVVNVSGAAASVALPMLGPIAASKAALESVSHALRMELRHQGIDVSIVSPGLMQTQLHPKAEAAGRLDGYAGTPESQRIYAKAIEASHEALTSSKEAPVDIAVEAIVKALTARRPATRYVVGRDARQLRVLRHLPDRLRDRLLLWNRGLKPEFFEVTPQTGR